MERLFVALAQLARRNCPRKRRPRNADSNRVADIAPCVAAVRGLVGGGGIEEFIRDSSGTRIRLCVTAEIHAIRRSRVLAYDAADAALRSEVTCRKLLPACRRIIRANAGRFRWIAAGPG